MQPHMFVDIMSELRATNYLLIRLINHLTGENLTDDYIRITYGVTKEIDMEKIKNSFWWLKKLGQNKPNDYTYQDQK